MGNNLLYVCLDYYAVCGWIGRQSIPHRYRGGHACWVRISLFCIVLTVIVVTIKHILGIVEMHPKFRGLGGPQLCTGPTGLMQEFLYRVDRNKYQIQIPLPPKIDPSVTMMTVEEKPDITYSDIGGCKEQIEKMREVSNFLSDSILNYVLLTSCLYCNVFIFILMSFPMSLYWRGPNQFINLCCVT